MSEDTLNDILEAAEITEGLFEAHITLSERLDQRMNDVFQDWCAASKTHPAYGVQSWAWGAHHVSIIQDTSARGCENTTAHVFPKEWFLVPRADSKAMIETHLAEKSSLKDSQELEAKRKKLFDLRAEAAALEADLGRNAQDSYMARKTSEPTPWHVRFPPVDIHSRPGTKIVFSAGGGHDFEKKNAKEILTIGETYTLKNSDVRSFSTKFILEEFPDKQFNSCLFCPEGWTPAEAAA